MSKKYVVLNALFALAFVACQPIAKKPGAEDPNKKQNTATTNDETNAKNRAEGTESPDGSGLIEKRSGEAIKKLELTRTEDYPMQLAFDITPSVKEDEKTKAKITTYTLHVSKYGANSEARNVSANIGADTPLYVTLDAIFQGKQTLINKPIPEGMVGAGTTSIRLTAAKDDKLLIINEPAVENGSATFFSDLIKSVHSKMDSYLKQNPDPKIEQKPADELVTDTSKDPSICVGLNLEGAWKYSVNLDPATFGVGATSDVTSTLVPLKTTDGSVQYTGTDVSTQQGCFGPVKSTTASMVYGYDGKTCRLIQKDKDNKLTSYLVTKATHTKSADGTYCTLVGLTVQACKDEACKEVAKDAQGIAAEEISMRRDLPKAK